MTAPIQLLFKEEMRRQSHILSAADKSLLFIAYLLKLFGLGAMRLTSEYA
jgi:hypothetical protein